MWLFDLRKTSDGKEKFNCENVFRVTVIRWVHLKYFLVIFLWHIPPGQIFPDQIAPWCIPLPENCRCRTQGSFGRTCVYHYYVLKWN